MTKNMMKTKFILLYLAVGLLFVNTAVAIDVPDGDLDTPELDDGAWAYVRDMGGAWSTTEPGGGPWVGNNYSYGGLYPGMGHTGAQYVDMNASYLHQGLIGETFEEGVIYELSLWAATESGGQGLNLLFLDGDVLDTADIISETGVMDIAIGAGWTNWSKYTLKYTATEEADGKTVGIGFWGGYWAYVDTVTLIRWGLVEPVSPAETVLVEIDETLEWTSPATFEALGYDLYFGTDPNAMLNPQVVSNELTNTYDPSGLQYDTTYYWQVDVYDPNEGPGGVAIRRQGEVWSFTTEPEAPRILSQPEKVLVGAGKTAEFSLEQTNGASYEWYKVGVAEPVASGAIDSEDSTVILSISDADESDEGSYYCKVIGQGSVTSETVRLVIAKLISHWQFEGDLVDSAGDNDGSAYGAAGASYAEGIVGNAASFNGTDPNGVISVGHSTQLNDDAFTVALWAKVAGGSGTWRSPLTSRSETSDPVNQFGYNLYASTGDTWQFWTGTNPAQGYWDSIGGAAVVEQEWVFLAATYDSRTLEKKFYVNGQLESQTVLNQPLDLNPAPNVLNIGGRTSLDPEILPGVIFNGLIDEVKIWNYPLNPYAVAKLYTDVAGGTICVEPALLLYDFDGSCRIDIGDIAVFASRWLGCNFAPDCLDEHTYKLD